MLIDALSAGLILVAFASLERRRELSAAAAVTLATLINLFAITAAAFAVFRPYRVPRFALWGIVCGAIGLLSLRLLVPQLLDTFMHQDWPNAPIRLVGAAILLAPLRRYWVYGNERFRLFFLASVLMFCVIFNHRAESPTFVIATTGVVIWFATARRTRMDIAAFAFFLIGTTLSSSDVMPEAVQEGFFEPYKFTTAPVLVIWALTQVELWRAGSRRSSGALPSPGASG